MCVPVPVPVPVSVCACGNCVKISSRLETLTWQVGKLYTNWCNIMRVATINITRSGVTNVSVPVIARKEFMNYC